MFRLVAKGLIAVALILTSLITGCADNSVSTGGKATAGNRDISYYFPTSEGYTTQYEVSRPNGTSEIITYEVGPQISIQGFNGRKWYVYDKNGSRSTSFIVQTSSDLYFYESITSPAENILSLPLSPGSSWPRFTTNDQTSDGSIDTTGGTGGSGLKGFLDNGTNSNDNKDGSVAGKNFPTDGSNTLLVESIETVVLSSGASFSGAVKLTNGGSGGINSYWFAPGVGLVKYVIGAQSADSNDGATVGELFRYGVI